MKDSCIAHWVHARLVYKTHQHRTAEAVFVLHKRLFPHFFFFCCSCMYEWVYSIYLSISIRQHSNTARHTCTLTSKEAHIQTFTYCLQSKNYEKMCFYSFKLNQSHWECSTKRITSNNFLFRQRIQLIFLLVQCIGWVCVCVCVFDCFFYRLHNKENENDDKMKFRGSGSLPK